MASNNEFFTNEFVNTPLLNMMNNPYYRDRHAEILKHGGQIVNSANESLSFDSNRRRKVIFQRNVDNKDDMHSITFYLPKKATDDDVNHLLNLFNIVYSNWLLLHDKDDAATLPAGIIDEHYTSVLDEAPINRPDNAPPITNYVVRNNKDITELQTPKSIGKKSGKKNRKPSKTKMPLQH